MTQHNDWSTMQQNPFFDMQSAAFAARGPLDSLAVAAPGRTRCVNAENPAAAKARPRPQPVHLARRARAVRAFKP